MSTPFVKGLRSAIYMAAILASAGCVPGLTHSTVIYYEQTKSAPVASLGAVGDHTNTVPSCGSVEVYRDHGMFYPLTPEGPLWSHRSFYRIRFKEGSDLPEEFYLESFAGGKPVFNYEVNGKVVVQGRHVLIDVEYKDGNGRWKKLPINGHHKIDMIFPDGGSSPKPRTQIR